MNNLDNVIWNSLNSRYSDIAIGDDLAKRFPPAFTSLVGLVDENEASFKALDSIVAPGEGILICSDNKLIAPSNYKIIGASKGAQMVCEKLLPCREQEFVELTKNDVPAMSELVELTQPGPFAERTIEFGTFYGIKSGGKLVAMAGERMKVPGCDEVSAVCTRPDHQGKGYGRALVRAVAANIVARGNLPFLHVRSENVAGIKAYESIGFKIRRELMFSFLEKIEAFF